MTKLTSIIFPLLTLAALILAGCAPAGTATPSQPTAAAAPAGTWQEISIAQAEQKRTDGALMLDVREQDEWDTLHIPGATLIPLSTLPTHLSELPKDQEIVVYCRSGNRSKSGAEILSQAGFTNVSSMAGGITEWQTAGYPTETGK